MNGEDTWVGQERRYQPSPPAPHPVKDIVLPLAVVIGLVTNALFVGISWGRLNQRLDMIDAFQTQQTENMRKIADSMQDLKDRVRDIERDAIEDRKDFLVLEDYTRGRIDDLRYKPPSSRK